MSKDKPHEYSHTEIHHMLFMGACMIQKRETKNPHGTAKTLWELTDKQAREMTNTDRNP